MSTSGHATDRATSAEFRDGEIVVRMQSGREIRFSPRQNSRLAQASPTALAHIELSPLGLHWPDLDEDLSYRGLLAGDYGSR